MHNGVVERHFVTARDRGMAMMFAARLNGEHQKLLWAEAVETASTLGDITVTLKKDKSAHELFYKQKAKLYKNLIEFGRIGYVMKRVKIRKKMTDKTIKCVFLGYE